MADENKSEPRQLVLDVGGVSELLGCSRRTVRRLNDAGAMPAAIRIGALLRWRRSEIEQWIAAGCPRTRRFAGR